MSPNQERFEAWVSASPYERSVAKYSTDPDKTAWPGQYRDLDVQLAWEAWQEAKRTRFPPCEHEWIYPEAGIMQCSKCAWRIKFTPVERFVPVEEPKTP